MSKNELNPGGVERLARALVSSAVRDCVFGTPETQAAGRAFLESDFAALIGEAYEVSPIWIKRKALDPEAIQKYKEYQKKRRK